MWDLLRKFLLVVRCLSIRMIDGDQATGVGITDLGMIWQHEVEGHKIFAWLQELEHSHWVTLWL